MHLTYLIGKELSVFMSPIISDGNLWLSTMPVKLAKMKKKMIFWDNDFDRMFDEAVEELEKNQENNKNNA